MSRALVLVLVAVVALPLAGVVAGGDGLSARGASPAGLAGLGPGLEGGGHAAGTQGTDDTYPAVADAAAGAADGRLSTPGSDPMTDDSDGDGLTDRREAALGSDPFDPDTDGDGFVDGHEVDRRDVLPGSDPLRIDVYVEVDLVEGATLPRSEVRRVVSEFADAPVGPGGARGIALHVVYDETDLDDRGPVSITGRTDGDGDETVTLGAYADDHRDYRGYGYHYLLVVPEIQDVSDAEVLGESGDGELLVQSDARADVRGSTLMHELGHSLGLDRDDFEGIDAYAYSAEEYPSVMNYNTGTTYYGYSADDPFDDWDAIVDDLHVPDTSRFEGNESDERAGEGERRASR